MQKKHDAELQQQAATKAQLKAAEDMVVTLRESLNTQTASLQQLVVNTIKQQQVSSLHEKLDCVRAAALGARKTALHSSLCMA